MNPPGFGPGPPTPRSLAVGGFDPDDDIVEVSSTSQLVALGPGGFPGAATRDLDPRAAAPQGGPSAPSWQGGATMADAWQVSPEAKGELPVVTGTTVPSSNEASRRDEDPWTIEFPPPLQKP